METSETVLLTKPLSLDHGAAAEVLTDEGKPRENVVETLPSESQLNTDLKKQNEDCPPDQDSIPRAEKMETDPAPAPENTLSWKERLTAEADSAAILSDITEDSIDGTSTDDSSRKTQ